MTGLTCLRHGKMTKIYPSSGKKKKKRKKFQFPGFGSDQICTHSNNAPEERVGREKENI